MQSPFTHNTVYRQYVYLLKDACSQMSMNIDPSQLKWEDNKQPECDTWELRCSHLRIYTCMHRIYTM